MGSHTSCIMDTVDSIMDADIIAYANLLPDFDDGNFATWCWRRWSPESKWYGSDAMIKISKKFSDRIFRFRVRGDYNYCEYYLNGIALEENEVFDTPRFPSATLFGKKLKEKRIRQKAQAAARAEEQATKAKKAAEAELAKLIERQKDLEKILSPNQ